MTPSSDTICAVATPAGRGGISVIRISGTRCREICAQLAGLVPEPRTAQYCKFRNTAGDILDFGLTLFFPGPGSFTGEDVCELQSHGSPVVVDLLLRELVSLGARLARPGEFSERAFLNDKIDLAQAEAIADLIDSSSAVAAQKALRSLQGEFSRLVNAIVDELTRLRIHVEAAIDFPDEEVDFLGNGKILSALQALRTRLLALFAQARQGAILREGVHVVLAGEPNAGKSTLLNALSGSDSAIVTDTPGTTRDILRQEISLDGLPVHLLDTAGLRISADPVEQEGIRRARKAIQEADRILLLVDIRTINSLPENPIWQELWEDDTNRRKLTLVLNKSDLSGDKPELGTYRDIPCIRLCAKHGDGMELLRQHLRDCAGLVPAEEGSFMARRRHLQALEKALLALASAQEQLTVYRAGELVAEELRRAQETLGEITGTVTSDDLLGAIFSSFCIGK